MVLSGTKKTSSLSSIVNQNQGGGNKKAGLPEQVGRTFLGDHPHEKDFSENGCFDHASNHYHPCFQTNWYSSWCLLI